MAVNPDDKVLVVDSVTGKQKEVTATEMAGTLPDVMSLQGAIAVAADFPTPAAVQNGWVFRVTVDVTDNDGTKTNTGQAFQVGQEIAWIATPGLWINVGPEGDRWKPLDTSRYTALPASTSTITFSDTTGIEEGQPVRFKIASTWYYGVVDVVAVDSLVTIAGAPLGAPTALEALEIGRPDMAITMNLFVGGASPYGDATDAALLANDMTTFVEWLIGAAYLVAFGVRHATDDTGAGGVTDQPFVTPTVGGTAVSLENTGTGPQVPLAASGWGYNSLVAIDTAAYRIVRKDDLELLGTISAGTPVLDAAKLTVQATFVLEN